MSFTRAPETCDEPAGEPLPRRELAPGAGPECRTVALARVAHVGSMNAAEKGEQSYEGHGLSVCRLDDVEEWERIAQLDGERWTLTSPTGRFLGYHALSAGMRETVEDWGVQRGYATRRAMWQVWEEDEDGERSYFLCDSRAKAIEEAQDRDGDETAVSSVATMHGTPELARRMRMSAMNDCFDYLLVCYVENELPGLDGVWWEDRYGCWSAPRGVILPGRLAAWTISPRASDDEMEAEAQGEWEREQQSLTA